MEFSHTPVLLRETIEGLAIKENGIYVDGTAGGGGHSAEILKHLTTGKLISIDQDPDAITTLTQKFKKNENAIVIKGNFGNMKDLLELRGVRRVDGVLLDIGVSSHQLDTASRGFSFHEDAKLDMRMSQSGVTAEELVNTLPYEELRRIIAEYGEERYASSIAKGIIAARELEPVTTTLQLAEIVKASVPQKVRRDGHPARKTFQAIRIAVNDELAGRVQAARKGRQAGGHHLPFAGGQDRQAADGGLVPGLYLSQGFSCLRVRKQAESAFGEQKTGLCK